MAHPEEEVVPPKTVKDLYLELKRYGEGAKVNEIMGKIIKPELLLQMVELEVSGADGKPHLIKTHPYAMFASRDLTESAKFIEGKIPQAFLPAVYNIPDENGVSPLAYFIGRGEWEQARKLLVFVSPEHLDRADNNIFHIMARASEPPPEVFLEAVKALPQEQQERMLKQFNAEGFTPYHFVSNHKVFGDLFLPVDNGEGMKIPNNTESSKGRITPTRLLFDSRTHMAFSSSRRDGQSIANYIRGRSVSDRETCKMLAIALDHGLCPEKSEERWVNNMSSYLMTRAVEVGEDERLAVLRRLHKELHQWSTNKPPEKGDFERWYVNKAAGSIPLDQPMFRRVGAQALAAGVDINQVTYESSGDVSGNILYNALRWQPNNFSALLNMEIGKGVKLNPDAALFTVRLLGSGKGDYDRFQQQLSVLEALKQVGVKVTRDNGGKGKTPIMDAMITRNAPLISYLLRNDLAMMPGDSKEKALKEWRTHLEGLEKKTSNNVHDWENYKQIREILTDFEKGNALEKYDPLPEKLLPPKVMPKAAPDPIIASLLPSLEDLPKLFVAEAHGTPNAQVLQNMLPPRKKSVA